VDKVDQLINLVGELVITQAMLAQTSSQLDANQHQQLTAGLADLQRNTRDLQEAPSCWPRRASAASTRRTRCPTPTSGT
jgi:hypothetical protein